MTCCRMDRSIKGILMPSMKIGGDEKRQGLGSHFHGAWASALAYVDG